MDYRVNIPWKRLEEHLQQLQRIVDSELRRAEGNAVYRLQGAGGNIEALMNLPETLKFIDEEQENMKMIQPKGAKNGS